MNVAIVGAAGKMGRFLTQAVCEHTALQLTAATEHPESTLLGADVGELAHVGALNVNIVGSLEQSSDFDVLIDFTRPEPCLKHLAYCVQHNKAMVIGTTGFSTAEKQQINDAGQSIPVVFAPNMSVGVNLLYKLLEMATEVMAEDADIEIIEAHHRHKVDAPSGTALGMGEAIAGTLNKPLNDIAVYTREGHTGEREAGSIGFATIRAADIVGEHTALFASEGERIELTHKASSRMTFAKGAVRAAAWLSDKDAGVYSMQDVLNLSSR